MRDILAEIVAQKKQIVAGAKEKAPLTQLRQGLQPAAHRMREVFRKGAWGLIAECKLQSPAKGRLTRSHSVLELAHIYEDNGAALLSVHTDPHFLGSNEDFKAVRAAVQLPLRRNDFVIDEYQIYEARALGADALLLIARILSPAQLQEYLELTESLGMDALVEVHDDRDLEATQATRARFLGINNRNLTDFTTDIQNTLDLLPRCDKSRVLISESGVMCDADVKKLQAAGLDGILVGEGLVRASDVAAQVRAFARS